MPRALDVIAQTFRDELLPRKLGERPTRRTMSHSELRRLDDRATTAARLNAHLALALIALLCVLIGLPVFLAMQQRQSSWIVLAVSSGTLVTVLAIAGRLRRIWIDAVVFDLARSVIRELPPDQAAAFIRTLYWQLVAASGAQPLGNETSAQEWGVTVLFSAANPEPTDSLALDQEVRDVMEAIRSAEHRNVLRLVPCLALRSRDLLQALNQHAPAIVHFSGHGRREGLVMLDDAGRPYVATREALVKVFGAFADTVRLVVLNACYGDGQARAITQEIDCAVGMPAEVDDEVARCFAAALYRALGFGHSVQNAFDQGCAAISLVPVGLRVRPHLITKPGVDASQVFLVEGECLKRQHVGGH